MTESDTVSISARKQRAVLALVERGSVAKAAVAAGVARQTVHRWMHEPEFALALREASSLQVEQASRRLTGLLDGAISVLEMLLESGSEHQKRLTADSVITHATRLRELTEIESRIQALEKRYE